MFYRFDYHQLGELCKGETQEDNPVDDGSDEETLQRKLLRLVRARITT